MQNERYVLWGVIRPHFSAVILANWKIGLCCMPLAGQAVSFTSCETILYYAALCDTLLCPFVGVFAALFVRFQSSIRALNSS